MPTNLPSDNCRPHRACIYHYFKSTTPRLLWASSLAELSCWSTSITTPGPADTRWENTLGEHLSTLNPVVDQSIFDHQSSSQFAYTNTSTKTSTKTNTTTDTQTHRDTTVCCTCGVCSSRCLACLACFLCCTSNVVCFVFR